MSDLVKRITKNIKIVLDNKIEEQAIENILYAKLAHLFALKNIKFLSCKNLKKASPLSHYALNFVGSGGHKNRTLDHIDDFVMSFINLEHDKINDYMASELMQEELELLEGLNKNVYIKEKNKIIAKYKNKRVINFEITSSTPQKMYKHLEKISRFNKGAFVSQISEFADFFKSSVNDKFLTDFLNTINNLYDGRFEISDSMTDERHTLKGIPFSIIYLTDLTKMLEEKTNLRFKENLVSGYARRIFFYINKNINYTKNPPPEPSKEEIKEAYNELEKCEAELKQIYDELTENEVYIYNDEADNQISEWIKLKTEKGKEFYKYTDVLTLDENISAIELEHSTWKIIKLAVILQLLKGKNIPVVEVESVQDAIAFYQKSRDCLLSILNEKPISEEVKMLNYFLNNQNSIITTTKIREQRFSSNQNIFSKWFKEALPMVQDMAQEKGFEIVELKKVKNSQSYLCRPIQKAENTIKLSYSHDLTSGYKFEEMTVDELKGLIKSNCNFVAGELKDGYRKDENYIGNQKTIWLDFDDGTTLAEAKEMFKDYWYLIYTSRNHQKVKGKKPACDRFRVILQTEQAIPADKYEVIMDNIIKEYNADSACKNKSRLYYGNADAQIFTNDGAYFDWSSYNVEPKKVQLVEQKAEYKGDNVGLTDETIDTDYGDKILKTEDIIDGNRDNALAYSVGVLIEAVNKGNLSHHVALNWFDSIAWNISTPDFKENIKKFRKRLEELKF